MQPIPEAVPLQVRRQRRTLWVPMHVFIQRRTQSLVFAAAAIRILEMSSDLSGKLNCCSHTSMLWIGAEEAAGFGVFSTTLGRLAALGAATKASGVHESAPSQQIEVSNCRGMTPTALTAGQRRSDSKHAAAAPAAKRQRSGPSALVQLDLMGRPLPATSSPSRTAPSSRCSSTGARTTTSHAGSQHGSGEARSGLRLWPASSQRVAALPGTTGHTDLGDGAAVAYHPATWSPADSMRLLQRLQVLWHELICWTASCASYAESLTDPEPHSARTIELWQNVWFHPQGRTTWPWLAANEQQGWLQSVLSANPCAGPPAQDDVAWEHREVRVHGQARMQPRLVAYMANDASLAYTYSGLTLPARPWAPPVAEIKVGCDEIPASASLPDIVTRTAPVTHSPLHCDELGLRYICLNSKRGSNQPS